MNMILGIRGGSEGTILVAIKLNLYLENKQTNKQINRVPAE